MFVLRRIVYSFVIVFMIDDNNPFFGTLILTLTSLLMLMFVSIEAYWESRMLNVQEIVNESVFYTLCLGLICFTDVLNETKELIALGWLIIGLVLLLMLFNVVIICYDLSIYLRLLCRRCKNKAAWKRKRKLARRKVTPISEK